MIIVIVRLQGHDRLLHRFVEGADHLPGDRRVDPVVLMIADVVAIVALLPLLLVVVVVLSVVLVLLLSLSLLLSVVVVVVVIVVSLSSLC